MLRELCVVQREWISAHEFQDAIAAANLVPGPAAKQLGIYCAWRVRGWVGAIVGGLCFTLPGLLIIIALAALFLAERPPLWIRSGRI